MACRTKRKTNKKTHRKIKIIKYKNRVISGYQLHTQKQKQKQTKQKRLQNKTTDVN
ncbi:hypothetical protein HMPREF3230_01055 [Gardnerella vaginalis]|uniref:Uncharacterized protein n=1 Tax=Gardnerella vaginalis TaxID=2702 RepID=A0A135Z474_GARVA|nr:hypothetical protein HMPREF3230_01055 [Gardnerella vaginalis]